MEVKQETRADFLFLCLKGNLDDFNAQSIEDNLMGIIGSGARQLIVDCSQIESINNTGLRMLLNVTKRIVQLDGRVAFHSASPAAKEIFDKTGFSMVSRVYDTREEAIAGVAASGILAAPRELGRGGR